MLSKEQQADAEWCWPYADSVEEFHIESRSSNFVTKAGIYKDSENEKQLCFYIRDMSTGMTFKYHFNARWAGERESYEGFARMMINIINDAMIGQHKAIAIKVRELDKQYDRLLLTDNLR